MAIISEGHTVADRPLIKQKPRQLDTLGSGSARPVIWAYGRHLLGGNIIFEQGVSGGNTAVLVALGEGEWESCDALWVNGIPFDITDTAIFHFHPGLDGEAGVETSPGTRNQKICSFFPTTFWPQLTFARTAYVAISLKPDTGAPDRGFQIQGIFKTRRVRIFDSSGTQTGYAYSENLADCLLDLLIERYVKPRARINESLTAAEKALFDFAGFDAWRTACNVQVNGKNRWECHLLWNSHAALQDAVDQVLACGRAYRVMKNGKFSVAHDESRASALTLGMDHLVVEDLGFPEKALTTLPNVVRLKYRDLDAGLGRGTISSSGTAVTGVGTDFLRFFKADHAIQLRSGAQKHETRKVASITSDTSLTLSLAFSANQAAGTTYGNPGLDFKEEHRDVEDHDLQDQAGIITDPEENSIEVGAMTPDRAERLARYFLGKATKARQIRCRACTGVAGLADLLPGDVVTAPSKRDFSATRDYRILEIEELADGGRRLLAEEFDAAIFSDSFGPQQPTAPVLPALHDFASAYGFHGKGGGNITNTQYCSGSTNSHVDGWRRLASGTIRLPKFVTKVLIRLVGGGSGTLGSLGFDAGDNIGIAIGTGSPPSSPTVSASIAETGGSIEITYNNPPTDVNATLWLFIKSTDIPISAQYTVLTFNANQDMFPLSVPGKVL